MICPNCGGEHASWALKCPYCDTVNDASSEKIYMEHMNNIRDRLDDLDDDAKKNYHSNMMGSSKRILAIAGIVVGAVVAVCLMVLAVNLFMENKQKRDYNAQRAWEKETFPKLDELYEAGAYDALLDENYRIVMDTDYSLYNWSHYYFICDFYSKYKLCLDMKEANKNSHMTESVLADGLYGACELVCRSDEKRLKELLDIGDISDGELEDIKNWQEDASAIIYDVIGWNQKALFDFYNQNKSEDEFGFLDWNTCQEKAKEILKKGNK